VKNGEVVELRVVEDRWSCGGVVFVGVSEVAMGSVTESPLLLFQRDEMSVPFNVILFEVCPQSTTTPRQHREGPTAIFLQISFVYGSESPFWFGYLPILCGIPKYACQTVCLTPPICVSVSVWFQFS